MKRREFLKRLGIVGGAALITPAIGLPWPREEPLPNAGDTILAGWNSSTETFWRNVPANSPIELPADLKATLPANVVEEAEYWYRMGRRGGKTTALGGAVPGWTPSKSQAQWWGLTDFTAADWGKGTGEGILYVGSTPLWSVKHGRTMWTPDEELLFPAGMVLRPDPAPRIWSAIIRKPGEPLDEWGMISDATAGRYLRLANPDRHAPSCTCSSACRAAVALSKKATGKWFDLTHYAYEEEAALPRFTPGYFPGLQQLMLDAPKENS
jgi:hypothetical protein